MDKLLKDKDKFRVIGMMSGTSLDGLDLVFAEFSIEDGRWNYKIIESKTMAFENDILTDIIEVLGKNINLKENDLNIRLGEWIGNCVLSFTSSVDGGIDLVASHGQTIFHKPENGITIQIGDGQTIANICNLLVVSDFRSQDVKKGGQGAPLVPIGDKMLFNDYKYCLNLGGIANISEKINNQIRAFDICICNIGANYLASKQGKLYDEGGYSGSKGKVIPELLKDWNDLKYFTHEPPKSLDASFFENNMQGQLSNYKDFSLNDVQHTLYEHIAFQISEQVTDKKAEILATGGGAYNRFLVELMKEKYNLKIIVPEKEIIEFKEALIFALMGVLRVRNENNVLAMVTGSDEDHSAGILHHPEQQLPQ